MLAGMVNSTSAYDPIARPEAALERRNIVIHSMAEQGMITDVQAAEALAAPLGVLNPLKTLPNGCIGAGDAGFFCKYVVDYLKEAGFSVDQINRGGYTIKTTLDSNTLALVSAALKAEVPPKQPHVANNMSVVQPGKDKHRVRAMASSRYFGVKAVEEQTSYGLPYEPVRLGAGSIYKIFTAATALKKGLGINDVIAVPPDGYTSPIYKDGSGRPIPVRNAGDYGAQMTLQDALAQSPNTAFVKLEEFTGIPDVVDMAVQLGMRSLAEDPFIDPRTQQRTNKSIAQVAKDQAIASFTLGVTETSVLELANVGATLASEGVWCPPSPIESITDSTGRPVPVIEEQCCAGRGRRPGQHDDGRPGQGPHRRHGDRCRRRVRLEPADGRQDRDHPAAQVGRIRRRRAAAVRRGDHLRQLAVAPAALRRRRLAVRVWQRQHLRRQDTGADLVPGNDRDPQRAARASAAGRRPAVRERRRAKAGARRGRARGERGARAVGAGRLAGLGA